MAKKKFNKKAADAKKLGRALLVEVRKSNPSIRKIEDLIAGGASVNFRTKLVDMTPLMWAAYEGHYRIAEILIEAGAKLNMKCVNGYTPLIYAIRAGYTVLAEMMIQKGAAGFDDGPEGMTPLICAAIHNDDVIVKKLLARNVRLDTVDPDNRYTAADWAAASGHHLCEHLINEAVEKNRMKDREHLYAGMPLTHDRLHKKAIRYKNKS